MYKRQVPNLFDHWISKNIIDYMHLAMGDRKRSTFLRVMNRPKRYISREYLTESQVSFDDLLEKVKDKPWLYEYVEDFKEDLRIMKNMTPLMAINYIPVSYTHLDVYKETGVKISSLMSLYIMYRME